MRLRISSETPSINESPDIRSNGGKKNGITEKKKKVNKSMNEDVELQTLENIRWHKDDLSVRDGWVVTRCRHDPPDGALNLLKRGG